MVDCIVLYVYTMNKDTDTDKDIGEDEKTSHVT